MDATRDEKIDPAVERRPTYEELVEENRRLQAVIRRLEARVAELERLVEKLSRESKRQAAPFRKQDQPAAEPKKPGRKSGRRHGPHAQRALPPRIGSRKGDITEIKAHGKMIAALCMGGISGIAFDGRCLSTPAWPRGEVATRRRWRGPAVRRRAALVFW
jgi:hypothetical protein